MRKYIYIPLTIAVISTLYLKKDEIKTVILSLKDSNALIYEDIKTPEEALEPLKEDSKPQLVFNATRGVRNYTKEEMIELISQYSEQYRVRPILAFAIAKHESGGIQQRRSRYEDSYYRKMKAGKLSIPKEWEEEAQDDEGIRRISTSYGVMQLMPHTALQEAKKQGLEIISPTILMNDADLNIRLGVAIVRGCIDTAKGDFGNLAKCYNGEADGQWAREVKKNIANMIMD